MLGEQLGAGGDTLHGKSAQKHGRVGVAGNAQGQQGDQGGARNGVVGRLGGHNRLLGTVPVFLGMLGGPLGFIVRQERGDGRAGAGHRADKHAQNAGLEQHHLVFQYVAEAGLLLFHLDRRSGGLVHVPGLGHDLRDGEQADEHGNGINTALHAVDTEGEAADAIHGIDADAGDQQPYKAHQQALDLGLSAHAGNNRQSKESQGEILGRAELQRKAGNGRRGKQQNRTAEQAADGGGGQCIMQSS